MQKVYRLQEIQQLLTIHHFCPSLLCTSWWCGDSAVSLYLRKTSLGHCSRLFVSTGSDQSAKLLIHQFLGKICNCWKSLLMNWEHWLHHSSPSLTTPSGISWQPLPGGLTPPLPVLSDRAQPPVSRCLFYRTHHYCSDCHSSCFKSTCIFSPCSAPRGLYI